MKNKIFAFFSITGFPELLAFLCKNTPLTSFQKMVNEWNAQDTKHLHDNNLPEGTVHIYDTANINFNIILE